MTLVGGPTSEILNVDFGSMKKISSHMHTSGSRRFRPIWTCSLFCGSIRTWNWTFGLVLAHGWTLTGLQSGSPLVQNPTMALLVIYKRVVDLLPPNNKYDALTFFMINPPLWSILHIVKHETAWPHVMDSISWSSSRYMSGFCWSVPKRNWAV